MSIVIRFHEFINKLVKYSDGKNYSLIQRTIAMGSVTKLKLALKTARLALQKLCTSMIKIFYRQLMIAFENAAQ